MNDPQGQIPQRVTKDNIKAFQTKHYRKISTTEMVGPITLSQATAVATNEGDYMLEAGWEGYIALDNDDMPYPVAKHIHEATYEEAVPNGQG